MTTPRLALPTFVTGPLDSLKAIDIYDVASTAPLNDITSVLDKLDSSIIDGMLPKFNTGALQGILKDANAAVNQATSVIAEVEAKAKQLTPEKLLQQGRALVPDLASALDGAGSSIKASVLDSIKQFEISPVITSNLENVFGSTSMDKLLQQSGVKSFVDTVKNLALSGNLDLGNKKQTSLLLSGVIHQGIKSGLGGFVKDILEAVVDPQTANLISGLVLTSVTRAGWLSDLFSISEKTSYGYVRAIAPTTIPNFVRSYRAYYDTYGNRNLEQELITIETTFNRIDPYWHSQRLNNGQLIQSFEQLMGASREFLDVAKYASHRYPAIPVRRNLAHLANVQQLSVSSTLTKEFPTLVFKR